MKGGFEIQRVEKNQELSYPILGNQNSIIKIDKQMEEP